MLVEPVRLEGQHVALVSFEEAHAAPLWAASQGTEIWRWFPFELHSADEMLNFVRGARALAAAGTGQGFAIERLGEPVGMTGLWNVDAANRRVEVGATWVARAFQRTAVNTEAKRLLLAHAFETLDCIRVEFKTDATNERSRAALLRIGAKEEGTLRAHAILPSGRIRDSVFFSILAEEWPGVRAGLDAKLAAGGA